MQQQATPILALADGSAVPGGRGLASDLRRADIESAIRFADDGLAELLLDLEAREVEGGATRRHTLAIGCTTADLERMLAGSGDSVRVSFDAEALERAIRAPEIEAHGLREKMVVLAVVVATTGAAAGTAQAMPTLAGHGGVSGGATATSTRDMPADSINASAASNEGAGATRANPSAAAATIAEQAQRAKQARLAEQARLDSYQAPAPSGHQVLPSGHHAAPVTSSTHGTVATDSSSVDSSTFVVVGGIALALLGAAFAAAATSRRTPTPT